MSNSKRSIDPETVLITLDQINQTIEVLSNVVTRLQRYVQTHMPQEPQSELPFAAGDAAEGNKKALH
jgi:hypothetical protein